MATVGSPAIRSSPAEPADQLAEPLPDPVRQLAGRLAGEGEAEDLLRADVPVGDQPDHPGGHRLGLAGAGAGDHQQRLDRRGDDGGLLAGSARGSRSSFGQLERGVPRTGCDDRACRRARRSSVTCRPLPDTGQLVLHRADPALVVDDGGERRRRPSSSAVRRTSACAQSGSSGLAERRLHLLAGGLGLAAELHQRRAAGPTPTPRTRPPRPPPGRPPSCGCSASSSAVAGVDLPVFRSMTTSRPCSSSSSRSTRPLSSTGRVGVVELAPTNSCSIATQPARVAGQPAAAACRPWSRRGPARARRASARPARSRRTGRRRTSTSCARSALASSASIAAACTRLPIALRRRRPAAAPPCRSSSQRRLHRSALSIVDGVTLTGSPGSTSGRSSDSGGSPHQLSGSRAGHPGGGEPGQLAAAAARRRSAAARVDERDPQLGDQRGRVSARGGSNTTAPSSSGVAVRSVSALAQLEQEPARLLLAVRRRRRPRSTETCSAGPA